MLTDCHKHLAGVLRPLKGAGEPQHGAPYEVHHMERRLPDLAAAVTISILWDRPISMWTICYLILK